MQYLIKNLAVSLSLQQNTPKCANDFAKAFKKEALLKRLYRGVERHKETGYFIEDIKAQPIKLTLETILSEVEKDNLSLIQIQKNCKLLTRSERDVVLRFLKEIIDLMAEREAKAENIFDQMARLGISIETLQAISNK